MVQSSASNSIMLSYAGLVLIVVLTLQCLETVQCSKYYGRHSALQFREKPRATRGFKSVALSTARGFGKRDSSFKVQDLDSPFTQKFSQKDSFPVDWLIEEMQNDPELMRTLVKKFIDTNQDDEISAEELIRPDMIKPINLNLEEEQ